MMTDDKPVRSIHAENLARLAPRAADTHKGQLGHALVIAGNIGMGGSGVLSAPALLHCATRWLHAFAHLGCGVASRAIYNSIRLLLEDHNPCPA